MVFIKNESVNALKRKNAISILRLLQICISKPNEIWNWITVILTFRIKKMKFIFLLLHLWDTKLHFTQLIFIVFCFCPAGKMFSARFFFLHWYSPCFLFIVYRGLQISKKRRFSLISTLIQEGKKKISALKKNLIIITFLVYFATFSTLPVAKWRKAFCKNISRQVNYFFHAFLQFFSLSLRHYLFDYGVAKISYCYAAAYRNRFHSCRVYCIIISKTLI